MITSDKIQKIVESKGGMIMARNDEGTQFRAQFPIMIQASNAFDALFSVARLTWDPINKPLVIIIETD